MQNHFMSAAALAAVFAFSATPILAETMNIDATGTGTSNSETMPLSEQLILVNVKTEYDGFDDPDSPFATVTGPCWGSVLIDKGAVSGGGLCQYTDADGESVAMAWTPMAVGEDGRTTGEWKILGGSGKWASATGTGTFDAGDSTGSYTNNVTGEITMN